MCFCFLMEYVEMCKLCLCIWQRYVIRISSLLDDMLASDEVISIMSKSTKTPQTSNLRSTLGSTLGSSVQSAFGSMNDMKDKGTLRSLPSGPTMTTPILKKGLSASLPSNTHVKVLPMLRHFDSILCSVRYYVFMLIVWPFVCCC